jgi:hypothetical protein
VGAALNVPGFPSSAFPGFEYGVKEPPALLNVVGRKIKPGTIRVAAALWLIPPPEAATLKLNDPTPVELLVFTVQVEVPAPPLTGFGLQE